ncbi:restriction endonuclease subunit S [Ruminococcus sp.]|uniref:restriction endonuclease subunit S n=1 Tax=Ruminococcus sp. TaxID=41978 RepID=UPI0025D2CFEA|nr:restriction endonuclease subunit S [Ruminococcus sp.]MCI6616573.1 restriction endonuclease subunit S [Ruminococcus sp.]
MAKLSSINGKKANVPKLRFPEFTEEWEANNIGEISTYIKGAPLSKSDISETGTPFILYGELYTTYKEVTTEIKRKTNCIVDKKYFSKIGDVVIPTSGETPEEIATATCVMTPNVILAGDLNIFRINDIDGRFFSYVINHKVNKDISRIAQGKSIVHIKGEEISKIQIKYPSAEEQQKILSFIELLSLKIEKQERLIEKLKKYKRGALSALFPKKGEITPQYRFVGFTKPWEQRKAKDLCSISTGKSNTQDRIADGIYPFYIRSPIVEHSNRYLFDEEAVLTVGDGVGTGKVFHYVNGKYDLHQRVYRMFDFSEEIKAKYFYYYFSNHFYDRVMAMTAKTSVDSVRYEMIADMDIALPKIQEQIAISDYFDQLDNLITLHQHKYDTLLSLKNALLQQMFI